MSTLNEQRQLVARKRHICQLCGRPILPGKEYIRQKWFDAGFCQASRHIHCDALLDAVSGDLSCTYSFSCDEVTEILRDTCAKLHDSGICSDDDYEDCTDPDCYSCYLVQRERLGINPTILNAAEKSVRDNDVE